jgi:hypothetical protein
MVINQYEKLQQMVAEKLLDLNDFYVVDLDTHRISLQGHFSYSAFKKYLDRGFDLDFDKECGWFKGRIDGVRMVLTLE